MGGLKVKLSGRARRRNRVRKKVFGTTDRPRLNVFRSNANIYAQLIDDIQGVTITAASTMDKDIKADLKARCNTGAAKKVGASIANKAGAKGVTEVVFDRGGYLYHGKIKALADAAREAGLKF